jgi:hypothetical protein
MDKIHEFPPIIKWKFGLDFGGHYMQPLRTILSNRELLFSDTMLSELTGRLSEQQKDTHQQLRNGIINRRIDEHEITEYKKDPTKADPTQTAGYGSGDKYGNCLQYSQQTQKLAAENGLPNTFILFGHPDHVFNVAVDKDNCIVPLSPTTNFYCIPKQYVVNFNPQYRHINKEDLWYKFYMLAPRLRTLSEKTRALAIANYTK